MVFVVIRARIIGNLAKGRERQSWIDPRPKMECDDLFFSKDMAFNAFTRRV